MKIFGIKIIASFLLLASTHAALAQNIIQGPSEAFGNAYGEPATPEVIIEFELGPDTQPTPTNYLQTELLRDVRISFTERSESSENGTKASLNGNELLVTETLSDSERTSSFVVNRNLLNASPDSNTITLTPINVGGTWGVTEITTSYIEAVDIVVSTLDSEQYGYLEEPSRLTGLRLNFKAATIFENYTLQVTGWDIDSADETQVFLNGLPLGYLSIGPNNDFNDGDLFILGRDDILPGGNQIEFVQRIPDIDWEGVEFEQWAISNLMINQLQVDLLPNKLSIKEEVIAEDIPFTSRTSVKNLGTTASRGAVLRYYTSTNSNISRANDVFLTSRAIPPVAANTTATFEQPIQTALIDRGFYLGVCVSVTGNDSDDSNNCSAGLLLDNEKPKSAITPVITILLLDESQ